MSVENKILIEICIWVHITLKVPKPAVSFLAWIKSNFHLKQNCLTVLQSYSQNYYEQFYSEQLKAILRKLKQQGRFLFSTYPVI